MMMTKKKKAPAKKLENMPDYGIAFKAQCFNTHDVPNIRFSEARREFTNSYQGYFATAHNCEQWLFHCFLDGNEGFPYDPQVRFSADWDLELEVVEVSLTTMLQTINEDLTVFAYNRSLADLVWHLGHRKLLDCIDKSGNLNVYNEEGQFENLTGLAIWKRATHEFLLPGYAVTNWIEACMQAAGCVPRALNSRDIIGATCNALKALPRHMRGLSDDDEEED